MRQVRIDAVDIGVLTPVIGAERAEQFATTARAAQTALHGRVVLNVNSTSAGGGVAEMLHSLLAYARGIGIDVRWAVVEGPSDFFTVTKRVHNRIYGTAGDGLPLGADERQIYENLLATQVDELLALLQPGDFVLLHDPQTLGLAKAVRGAGARVIWRCHIGRDQPNCYTADGWQFLGPYLEFVELVVVSHRGFAPPGFPADLVRVIPPSIDPLSVKNAPLDDREVSQLLGYAGLLQVAADDAPIFHRRDGSPARLDRRADVVQLGPPPPPDHPLVVQVSRWDRLKDMAGVLAGFAAHVRGARGAHLVLAGPNVTGVADDPEGAAVFTECVDAWRRLPHAQRQRVHLACLPTADTDENAVLVNALQRRATVIVQKSLAEGFGLTVAEAMWKGRPVVASAVGGITGQISDDSCGLLLADPTDLVGFGRTLRELLHDPERARKLGEGARQCAHNFLPDTHLGRWAQLLAALVPAS